MVESLYSNILGHRTLWYRGLKYMGQVRRGYLQISPFYVEVKIWQIRILLKLGQLLNYLSTNVDGW